MTAKESSGDRCRYDYAQRGSEERKSNKQNQEPDTLEIHVADLLLPP